MDEILAVWFCCLGLWVAFRGRSGDSIKKKKKHHGATPHTDVVLTELLHRFTIKH